MTIKRLLVFGAVLVGVGVLIASGLLGTRFKNFGFALDESNMQRVRTWRTAPAMIAAAPHGWGERPGMAYSEWFQDFNDDHPLVYLVSGHLTHATSHGWAFTGVYIFAWTLLGLAMLVVPSRFRPLGLSVWSCFFLSDCISTMSIFKSLWVVPACALVAWAWGSASLFRPHLKRISAALVVAAIFTGALFCGLLAFGRADLARAEVPVRRANGITYVGSGEPSFYALLDSWVLARYRAGAAGRDIRAYLRGRPQGGCVAVADSVENIPDSARSLLLVGLSAVDYCKSSKRKDFNRLSRIMLMSSPMPLRAFKKRSKMSCVVAYSGALLAERTEQRPTKGLHVVPGAELYWPDWMSEAFRELVP